MPSSDEPLEIYVDRSLGQLIVPEALRELGIAVKTEVEVFGGIRRACRQGGPFVYSVHSRGIERLWPKESA